MKTVRAPAVPRPRKVAGAEEPGRRERVQAAQTGMAVLKGLTRLGGRGSLTALGAEIGENPAKVHRYLASLVAEGFVDQDPETHQYFLGSEAVQLGLAAMRQADPLRVGTPALARIREELGATCFLAVMGNMGPTVVRMDEPALPVVVNARVGSVLPLLWSSTGRAFLGFMDEGGLLARAQQEYAAASRERRHELGGRDAVSALRAQVRADGVATVRDTYLAGISAVSAPLFDHSGRVCAVLTALGPTGGFDAAPAGLPARVVVREAAAASRVLGAPPTAR